MSRRVVGVVVVAGLIAAGLWWWQRGDRAVEDGTTEAGHVHVSRVRDPHDPAKRAAWLGQAGVADRTIAGTVVGEAGPIAGASVRLVGRSVYMGLEREARATTDASGHFDFGERSAMFYSIGAEAPGLIGLASSLDLRDPNLVSDPITLVLHPCTASVHGTVRDAGGGVIAKAHVSRQLAFGMNTSVDTDNAGEYDICVLMSGALVTVEADGYARVNEFVSAYGRVHHDFILGPETPISGHVVRAGDHTPVADAVVELHGTGDMRSAFATTDSEGHFNFEEIGPGKHSLIAYSEHLASMRPVDVITEVGIPSDTTIELAPTSSISGKVVGRDHTPIAGVELRLAPVTAAMRAVPTAVSQSDGTFVIDHLLPGDYKPYAFNRPVPDARAITLGTSDVKDVVIEMDKRGTIAGRVMQHGHPVEGATVHSVPASGGSALSDADGKYILRGVPAGTFSITADSKRLGAFSHGPSVTLAADQNVTGVDVDLDLASSVAGIVVDQTNAPVPGVVVYFVLGKDRDFGTATTGDDGTFEARTMSGGGDYTYRVVPSETSPITYRSADGKPFPPVSVPSGDTHIRDLRIAIQLDRLVISGHVLDAQGQPVSDATVQATPVATRRASGPSAVTDTTGAFAIHELSDGAYNVLVSAARGEAREQAVAAGRTDLVLHLTSLGSIDGTLAGFGAPPEVVVGRDGDRLPSTAMVTGAAFHVGGLAPGMYRVVARSKTGFDFEYVAVGSDAPATVALHQLAVGGTLSGTLADAAHAPRPGVLCTAMSVPRELDLFAGEVHRTATTDANGAYKFERLVEGTVRVACEDAQGTATINNGDARLDLVAR